MIALTALPALLTALAAEPSGYRGDGSGRYDAAPVALTAPPRWTVPLDAWSNAGVVVVGELACTTAEPTDLLCVDRSTGALRWRAPNGYGQTLDAPGQEALARQLALADEAAEALSRARAEYSRIRREVRRDPSLAPRLDELLAEAARLERVVEAAAVLRTPPVREIIGYATATPVTDGAAVYAAFGNGVVSAFEADGTRRWSVWLGPAPGQMNGYHVGTATSPVLADGVLVVGHRQLVGLDPRTGAVRWRGPTWVDYGTPAPVVVDGVTWLATPAGELVRARDGHVGATGLGAIWFIGPVALGDRVLWAGGQGATQVREAGRITVAAWRVRPAGAGVAAEPQWTTEVRTTDPVYAAPVVHGDHLVMVDASARVLRVPLDGAAPTVVELPELSQVGATFGSLSVARDQLYVAGDQALARLALAPAPAVQAMDRALGARAGVGFDAEGHAYLRTLTGLVSWGAP